MIDFLLDFIPWWILLPAAIAIIVVVWRIFGLKATLAAVAAAVVAAAYRHGRQTREHDEAIRRAREQLAGANERLEMNREATEAERKARDLPDEEARREALKWAKR